MSTYENEVHTVINTMTFIEAYEIPPDLPLRLSQDEPLCEREVRHSPPFVQGGRRGIFPSSGT